MLDKQNIRVTIRQKMELTVVLTVAKNDILGYNSCQTTNSCVVSILWVKTGLHMYNVCQSLIKSLSLNLITIYTSISYTTIH